MEANLIIPQTCPQSNFIDINEDVSCHAMKILNKLSTLEAIKNFHLLKAQRKKKTLYIYEPQQSQ